MNNIYTKLIIIISLLFLILNELKNINATQLAHQEEVVIINIIKRIVSIKNVIINVIKIFLFHKVIPLNRMRF